MNKITLAIAEDNEVDYYVLKRFLEHNPKYTIVLHAYNGAEFINKLKPLTSVDIAIIDMKMPVLNGLETVKLLVANDFKGKILGVTHGFYQNYPSLLKNAGAHGFCGKLPDQILPALDAITRGEIWFNNSDYEGWKQKSDEKDLCKFDEDELKKSINPAELKIIRLLARGYNSKEMSNETGFKSTSIDQYKSRLIFRLNLKNDKHLVAWAFSNGLLGTSDFYPPREASSLII